MTSELGDERDPETGAFDADEWFRAQFGGDAEPTPPPVAPTPPVVPAQPVVPPAPVVPPPLVPPLVPPTAAPTYPQAFPPAAPPQFPPAAPPVTPPVAQPTYSVPSQPGFPPAGAPLFPPAAPAVPPVQPAFPPTLPPGPLPFSAPPFTEPAPTQLAPIIEPEPTQPAEIIPAAPSRGAATELLAQPDDGGALDALFGSDSFQEYDDTLISAVPRSNRRGGGGDGVDGGDGTPGEKAPLGRTQKILLWVAGSLVAVLALVAIFFVGTRIPLLLGPAPGVEPLPSASASPSASATPRPIGPVPLGEYRWDEVWGGECIQPFVDAWQEEVKVVDCATPHGGQLVLRVPFPSPQSTTEPAPEGAPTGLVAKIPYPGEEALAAQMSLLCSAAGVIDLSAAGGVTDLQVQGAYPVSEEQWDAGERDYFCFVSRSSGEPITGSLAVPPPAPVP